MLSLTCAPAECQVSSEWHPHRPNRRRQAGSGRADAWQLGGRLFQGRFRGHQSTVVVEPAKSAAVTATLDPDRAAREAFGKQLFQKMIHALGGDDGLKTLGSVQATGSTTLWGHDGTSVRWTLLMRNRTDRALFQAKAGRILHEVMFEGSEFKASKNLKGDEALRTAHRLRNDSRQSTAGLDRAPPGPQLQAGVESSRRRRRRGLFDRRRVGNRQNLHRLRREFAPAASEDRDRRRYRLAC